MNLGAILIEMPGRAADAVAEFQQAVKLDPGIPEAHSNLGYALLRMPGRVAEATAEFEASLRLRPDADVQAELDRLRKAAGRSGQ